MGEPVQKRIVIARYKEDINWIDKLPTGWLPVIIQKKNEELDGDMPNAGREPGSFLFAIAKHYNQIKPNDVWAFVQGNPFDHCANFMDKIELAEKNKGYTPLGGSKACDDNGAPDHPNLPIKQYYKKWLHRTCPKDFKFTPGGQFIVRGKDLLRYSRQWYVDVMDDVTPAWNCYIMERIWGEIYAD